MIEARDRSGTPSLRLSSPWRPSAHGVIAKAPKLVKRGSIRLSSAASANAGSSAASVAASAESLWLSLPELARHFDKAHVVLSAGSTAPQRVLGYGEWHWPSVDADASLRAFRLSVGRKAALQVRALCDPTARHLRPDLTARQPTAPRRGWIRKRHAEWTRAIRP